MVDYKTDGGLHNRWWIIKQMMDYTADGELYKTFQCAPLIMDIDQIELTVVWHGIIPINGDV